MLAKSQQIKPPFALRCDLLLKTNKVSKSGIAVDIPLESAILQKDSFQFPVVYNQHPLFNWEVASSRQHCNAYRILVASSIQLLNQNKADFWDSKKTASHLNKTTYQGADLLANKIYYWKVQVWDEKNNASPFSANARKIVKIVISILVACVYSF
jgi:hypothetical protein